MLVSISNGLIRSKVVMHVSYHMRVFCLPLRSSLQGMKNMSTVCNEAVLIEY